MRRPSARTPSLTALVASVLCLVLAVPVAAADPDVTPPSGTFTIGDGSAYVTSPVVTLHIDATDDVGVTEMGIALSGQAFTRMPYADSVSWTLPGEGSWTLIVELRDAAGNASWATSESATVTVDATPPTIDWLRFFGDDDGTDAVLPASIEGWDSGSPVVRARFRTGSGSWGAPIEVDASKAPMVVPWHMLDPAAGGSSRLGTRTVYVEIQDAAGNWSAPASERTTVGLSLPLSITGDQRTGHVVTFTPVRPAPVTFPSGTTCWWELAWGDAQSLNYGEHDDTFGIVTVSGAPSDGYCDPWSVTIPWVPVRRFLVSFRAIDRDGEPLLGSGIGGDIDEPYFTPGVDSTSRRIRSSSMPMVYVLPESYTLTVGEPTTYHAYALAGETIRSTDRWSVEYVDVPEVHYGGSSFTFVPKRSGHLTVCWSGAESRAHVIAACYDPRARYPDHTRPNTTAPVERLIAGSVGTTVPVKLTWSGTDSGWGIASFTLQQSTNGGAWHTVALPKAKATTVTRQLSIGTAYRFRIRATDKAGNVGDWDYGPTFRPAAPSKSSAAVRHSPAWTPVADPTARGGTLIETGKAGASVRGTFTARDIAWLGERGPGHGKARIYVDGVYIRTVDLEATTDRPQRIVFSRHFATKGTHTLRIVAVGTSGRPIVDVDGFILLR